MADLEAEHRDHLAGGGKPRPYDGKTGVEAELLLQPGMLAELKRYRALERRVQVTRRQCQEFKELAKQVASGNAAPLATPLGDGSPAAELDAALAALKGEIETIYQIEAELNEQVRASRRSTGSGQLSIPSQVQRVLMRENMKIALWVVGGVVLFVVLLMVLHGVVH